MAAEETRPDGLRPGDVIQREVDDQIARKAKARGLRAVPTPQPIVIERGGDGYDALVLPGLYAVKFARESKVKLRGRFVWHLWFTVIEGEAAGIELRMFLNALPNGQRPGPGWFIGATYNRATGLRPPADLYRIKPSEFLKDCVFEARVVDVAKAADGAERVGSGRYSRVLSITKTAGNPPCIQKRRGNAS